MTLYMVISVDVETPQTPLHQGLCKTALLDPIVDNGRHGYSHILRILSRFQIHGVFFVNVYEASLWDETLLRRLCVDIQETGNEVGLHTHPEWRYDSSRIHMWQYSLGEQIRIIADGLALIQQWVPGYRVVSHRAGAYGLNEETVEALRANDIRVDSSMFYGHPNCKASWCKNQLVAQDGVFEIPVTEFERHTHLTLAGLTISSQRTFVKTDLDWASLDELLFFVEEAKKHDIRVMNLFMHSYSFIRFNKDFNHFEPDYEDMDKFERFLSIVAKDPDIKIVTMRNLYNIYEQEPERLLGGSDYVPAYRQNIKFHSKVLQVLKARFKKHG